MIPAALLLLGQALSLSPPTDWAALPRLGLALAAGPAPQLADFVDNEVRSGRCALAGRTALDMAVLVAENGQVRRIVPRAIDCPAVEQFAAGVVLRAARNRVRVPESATWYVTTVALTRP